MSQVLPTTPGADLICIAFRALNPDEQVECLERCRAIWLEHEIDAGNQTARMIASLGRVAEVLGAAPGVEDYRRIRAELALDGEELEPSSQIIRHFGGSWHQAREALDLSESTSPRRIEERFRHRQLGKVWRYTEDTLRETLSRATEAIGRVPQVSEFDFWREREIELARARGEEIHLPSAGPYRRRYGNWEQALLHFGYTPDQVAERLERH